MINIIRKIIFLGFGSTFLNYFGFLELFYQIWDQILMVIDYIIEIIKMYFKWIISIWKGTKEEIETPEPEVNFLINNENENNNEEEGKGWKNILIITSIIVITCFIYVYFDEIKDYLKPKDPGTGRTDGEKIEIVNSMKEKAKQSFVLPSDYLNDPLKNISQSINNGQSSKVRLEDLPKVTINDGEVTYYEIIPNSPISSSSTEIMTNSPTGSSSSTETITPSTLNVTTSASSGEVVSTENVSTLNETISGEVVSIENEKITSSIDDLNWKSRIDPNIKESVDYVENHFPSSELDNNIEYIKGLIEDVKIKNTNYAQSTLMLKETLPVDQLLERADITTQTDNWVNDMFERLKPFE